MGENRYDIVVIGADAAGLAAAACAAAEGASVALVRTGSEAPAAFSTPQAPNFVWRALELHQSDYRASPASARISLFTDDESLATYEDAGATLRSIAAAEGAAEAVWPDFLAGTARLDAGEAASGGIEAADLALEDEMPAPLIAVEERGLGCSRLASANDVLDDYFQSERLKTHLAGPALMALGLAGDEPGSAAALRQIAANGWPSRAAPDGASLVGALEAACARGGVVMFEGVVETIRPASGGDREVLLRGGEKMRVRFAMAPSAALALASGLTPEAGYAPLVRAGGARAFVRIAFNEPPHAEGLADGAVHYIIENRDVLAAARDVAAEGRLPDAPPLMFETDGRAIIVSAPFCPSRFVDENGEREWTGQDRQAFGRMAYERVKAHLSLTQSPRAIDVRVDIMEPPGEEDARIATPAPHHDEIGAAAAFALKAVRHD